MITICTWLWGNKYTVKDVAKLRSGVERHLKQPHRFIVISDQFRDAYPILDTHLYAGCFARLRLFDPRFQESVGVEDRIVVMDLDSIVTGPLDVLFDRPDNFMTLTGVNAANPCPYNGSVWMLRAGYRPDVWHDFSLEAAEHVPYYEFPDDQAWLAHKIPNVVGWKAGSQSGIYGFQKPGWPKGKDLPHDARLVVFPGWRAPSKFTHLPWVKEHWQ
jgi:hypothetical protein